MGGTGGYLEICLRDIVSEPLELVGDFNDETDYENAMEGICVKHNS
jgi:hypothetical protein